jgi:hypothetical protein
MIACMDYIYFTKYDTLRVHVFAKCIGVKLEELRVIFLFSFPFFFFFFFFCERFLLLVDKL